MAKKFLTSISICYVQEKNPFSFFSQICLFQTFYSHIYPQNVQFFYMPIQIEFKQKYFNWFVKILNQSTAQDLSNNKNRSFLRFLWAQIFLRQFIKFWHKRAILCAPTVIPWHLHSTEFVFFKTHLMGASCGSVTFWYGSGSETCFFRQWLMPTKNNLFFKVYFAYCFLNEQFHQSQR